MLKVFQRTKDANATARRLYEGVVAQARDPAFFGRLGVPDTVDGRFDLICLHAWLVLERIEANRALAQAFVNEVFAGFDEALRQSGTGDVGMNRRLKTLASAFYGRLEAYRAATATEELAEAIQRNLFRGAESSEVAAKALVTYAFATRSGFGDADLTPGHLTFAAVPSI